MADDGGGDMGGGGMSSSSSDGSTGYGSGRVYSANSESGPFSSPDIQAASYSNTGAEGSQPLPETWTSRDEVNRQANVIEQAPSKTMPSSSASPSSAMLPSSVGRGTFQAGGSSPSGPVPEYYPGASNPTADGQQQPSQPEEKLNSKLPGQGGTPPLKSMGPKKERNPYEVTRNPFPFMPDTPGSGGVHNKNYYEVQNNLLKTMLPYWNK